MNSILKTTEATLVAGLKAKKSDSYDHLVKNYSYALQAIIGGYLKNEQDQEDLLQEVWMKIWRSIHKYDDQKAGLYCWMATIARNLCIDTLRKFKTRKTQDKRDIDLCENTSFYSVDQKEEHIGIEELLDDMKDKELPVAKLFFFEGYTHNEISEELNIPVGTSKSRLRSGIKNIRKYTPELTMPGLRA
ncbi:RNA polymerase sigma factor [Jiulongibacter sp. NS-SX5]|uniref:RNA polymerase sigma factor n=1 Tax=Jiulongibacter sp. NS-SX5 TaxID=3463854 RepID=UPI00405A1936